MAIIRQTISLSKELLRRYHFVAAGYSLEMLWLRPQPKVKPTSPAPTFERDRLKNHWFDLGLGVPDLSA